MKKKLFIILTIILFTSTLIIYQNNEYHKIKKIKIIINKQEINKQELIIKEIKEQINHIDINHNNVINNEQKRLQSCQTLIDKINSYHEEKIIYQSLLSWQKELINKQKLIKHYHQSLIGELINIIINIIIMIMIINMIISKTKNKKIAFLLFIMFHYYCVNYFFNNLFNDNNERLFNTINYFFRYRYISKKTLNHYLFVDEKQVGSFLYNRSMSFIHNQQKYYYVPLIFDHTCNWFLSFFSIIYALFFIFNIFFIFRYCCFFYFDVNIELKEKINNIIINDNNNNDSIMSLFLLLLFPIDNNKLTFNQTLWNEIKKNIENKNFKQITTKLAENFIELIITKNIYTSLPNEELSTVTLKDKIITNKIFKALFIKTTFFSLLTWFDYAHTLFNMETKKTNLITVIFYWQHTFNEVIKNIFKSLPIIKNHYFYQPSLCQFWYPMVLFLIYILLISFNFFLFGLFHQKPMLFFNEEVDKNRILNEVCRLIKEKKILTLLIQKGNNHLSFI